MEMNEEFHIETVLAADVASLSKFLRDEYPEGDIADERFLQWEYLDNPFGKAFISCARNKNQVLATQYAAIPFEVVIKGKTVSASLSLNTLTAKEFRGKGLFVRTAESNYSYCAENGVLFTVGIPNANSFPGFTKKLNFTHCGNLNFLVRPLRPLNILRSFIKGSKIKKGNELSIIMDKDSLAKQSVSFFDPFADRTLYEPFWHEWESQTKIILNRTPEYLSWRYLQIPSRKYHLMKIIQSGKMKAMAVFRTLNIYGLRACVLMDFFCTDNTLGKNLLDVIAKEMKINRVDIMIAASASMKGVFDMLKNAGFMRVPEFLLPQQLPFIIRLHNKNENSDLLSARNNWHFTFGDYDIF